MIAAHIANWALNKRRDDNEHRVAAIEATQLTTVKPYKEPKHTNERVLETKGGGGQYVPPQPTPQEQAQARDWEAQQDFEREQRRQDAIDKAAKEDKDAKMAAWQSSKGSAYQGALSGGTSRLNALGIQAGDPYGVYSDFTNRLNTANAGLAEGSDYSSAFSPTVLDEVLGGARTGQRNKYKTAFEGQIPSFYGEDTFSSTSDDAILSSILDQQYADALADLGAARDRGQASSSAYERAVRDLGTAKGTANSDLQNVGRGILSDITNDIGTRRSSALDRAANWDFGSTFDPTGEASRIKSYGDERRAGLEGEIRGAIGGKEYFDVNSLLGKASAKVGNQTTGTTTGTTALRDTFANEATRNEADTRANEGIF